MGNLRGTTINWIKDAHEDTGEWMNQIDVIISTRNRYEKLMNTIDSIPGEHLGIPIHINIACDGDLVTYNKIRNNERIYNLIFTPEQKGAVYCRNELSKDCISSVIYATDDIIFSPGAIKEALKMMYDKFPDDDGVVGFCQIGNRKFSKSGVGMIGIDSQYMDETHADARIHKEEDHRKSEARRKAGEIWGDCA
jgi:hypothetical protein